VLPRATLKDTNLLFLSHNTPTTSGKIKHKKHFVCSRFCALKNLQMKRNEEK